LAIQIEGDLTALADQSNLGYGYGNGDNGTENLSVFSCSSGCLLLAWQVPFDNSWCMLLYKSSFIVLVGGEQGQARVSNDPIVKEDHSNRRRSA
jgi:hypothetical protein